MSKMKGNYLVESERITNKIVASKWIPLNQRLWFTGVYSSAVEPSEAEVQEFMDNLPKLSRQKERDIFDVIIREEGGSVLHYPLGITSLQYETPDLKDRAQVNKKIRLKGSKLNLKNKYE